MRGLDLIAVLLLVSSTASAQTTLFELTSGEPNDEFGTCIANVGDVDLDGVVDLGVGAPRSDLGGVNAGAAYVFSGRTGLRLQLLLGTQGIRLGTAMCAAGDVDADGFPDILISAPQGSRASVYSGRTGAVIRTYFGGLSWDLFGAAVGNVGDIDADGADDHALNAPGATFDYAVVFSGHSGDLLHTQGTDWFTVFGAAFLGLGDLDADGYGDYAIGEPTDTSIGISTRNSWVRVYSGMTGSELFNLVGSESIGSEPMSGLGSALASPGDLDGDGKAEIWAGAPFSGYAGHPAAV